MSGRIKHVREGAEISRNWATTHFWSLKVSLGTVWRLLGAPFSYWWESNELFRETQDLKQSWLAPCYLGPHLIPVYVVSLKVPSFKKVVPCPPPLSCFNMNTQEKDSHPLGRRLETDVPPKEPILSSDLPAFPWEGKQQMSAAWVSTQFMVLFMAASKGIQGPFISWAAR